MTDPKQLEVERIVGLLSDANKYHVIRECGFDGIMRCDPQINYLRDLGIADVIELSGGDFMSRLTLFGQDVRAHLLAGEGQ